MSFLSLHRQDFRGGVATKLAMVDRVDIGARIRRFSLFLFLACQRQYWHGSSLPRVARLEVVVFGPDQWPKGGVARKKMNGRHAKIVV